jgi:hypothetical protein
MRAPTVLAIERARVDAAVPGAASDGYEPSIDDLNRVSQGAAYVRASRAGLDSRCRDRRWPAGSGPRQAVGMALAKRLPAAGSTRRDSTLSTATCTSFSAMVV